MLRVASTTRVFSHAVGAIPSRKIRFFTISNALISESPTVSDRHFSTCSSNGNRKVVEALKSEIESHDLALMKRRGLPANIPFTISDDPGYMHIMMNRDLGEEKIEVTVNPIPDFSNEDVDAELKNSAYINVSLSKEKKGTLDFGGHVSADEIVLDRVSYTKPNYVTHLFRYMVDKEGEVQDAFREFVKIRGIEKSNVGFLYNYMKEKRQSWATVWTPGRKPETDELQKLKKFFEEW